MAIRLLVWWVVLCGTLLYASKVTAGTHLLAFQGKHYFDIPTLVNVAGGKGRSAWEFWKEDVVTIDDRLIPTLQPTLKAFYRSEGFYHAKIVVIESNTTLTLKINAGSPTRVGQITIKSDYNLSKIVSFHHGERFAAAKFTAIKATIVKQLLEEGYCSYRLDTKAYVDLERNRADLNYTLAKGKVCHFGETTINGLKHIDKDVVLSRVVAKKGERYSTKKLKATYNAIEALESFDQVTIDASRNLFTVIPVTINVEEIHKPYHYEIGAGYDTFIGPRIHGEITKKNFLGNAQKATLKAGWSKREQLLIADFFKPAWFWAFGYGIDLMAKAGYTNLEYRGFREEKSQLRVALAHQEGRVQQRLGLAIEAINISLLGHTQNLTQAINDGNFLLVYPYLNLIYDARDDKLNAKSGYYLEAMVEYALPYKPDVTSYTKSFVEARWIETFFEKLTLAGVLKAGVVDLTAKELPESKLFFAGGAFSNRAYGYNAIGVILSPTKDTINGAYSMLNLSLEADYPIVGNLYGALFSDRTMLTDRSYDFGGSMITAVGVGVRYVTPVGPFKLDVGWNVHETSHYGISFQIGQSF